MLCTLRHLKTLEKTSHAPVIIFQRTHAASSYMHISRNAAGIHLVVLCVWVIIGSVGLHEISEWLVWLAEQLDHVFLEEQRDWDAQLGFTSPNSSLSLSSSIPPSHFVFCMGFQFLSNSSWIQKVFGARWNCRFFSGVFLHFFSNRFAFTSSFTGSFRAGMCLCLPPTVAVCQILTLTPPELLH